ncbi:MAG: LprI family protein, partial [Candidatus Hydrogenedentes bacterium]|nr:LprI family protein [Candidatus Hydrogenedentota bacterium]
MPRFFCLTFLTLILCFVSASAAPEEEWKQKLQNAEAQLTATYAQVEAQLDPAQKLKLQAAQKAWEEYRKLAVVAFAKEIENYAYSGEQANSEFLASLTWSRVSHLKRMLERRDLVGSDAEFRDADDSINKMYREHRRYLNRAGQRDTLKEAQRAWITYRDASAESESTVCPNRTSAALLVKTELTYERAFFLQTRGFRLGQNLSGAPTDIEREMRLSQLSSESADVRKKALDYFEANAADSLPILIAQLKLGMLPPSAAPIFENLGAKALPTLLELLDSSKETNETLPKFLAAVGPVAIPELLSRISSSNSAVSLMSMNALALLGPNAKEAIPSLLRIIENPDDGSRERAWRRSCAAQAALNIDPDNPVVVKGIVEAYIAFPTGYGYTAVLCKLGPAAKAALPTLINRGRDSDGDFDAMFAVLTIISPEDTELTSSLIEGLVDPNTVFSYCFGDALVKIGDHAVPQLEALLQGEDKVAVRRAAATLVRFKHPADTVIEKLVSLSKNEDPTEAVYFIDVLSAAGESAKPAVPTLWDLYRSNRPGVSAAALLALQSINPDSPDVKKVQLPAAFVFDPYYDARCYAESEPFERVPRLMTEADFNNDGAMDIGISDSMGNHGAPWQLYLKVGERKYKKIDELDTVSGMELFVKEKGVGYLKTYLTTSAATGVEALYTVSMDGLRLVKSVDLEWAEGRAHPVEANEQLPALEGYTKVELNAHPIEK